MDGDYVLVIGSAMLEVSARTIEVLQPGIRQTGYIYRTVSGVARNIAENLARLDIDTVLLCAVADDDIGQHVITHSSLAGIDCSHVLRVNGARTATAVLLYQSEDNCTRVDDLGIADALDSDLLARARVAIRECGAGRYRRDAFGRRAGYDV